MRSISPALMALLWVSPSALACIVMQNILIGGLVDYNSTQQVVGFTSTTTTATIRYSIVDDDLLEDREYFNVTLVPLSDEVLFGDNSQATVWISDNDGKLMIVLV